jgi:hypothetical protein
MTTSCIHCRKILGIATAWSACHLRGTHPILGQAWISSWQSGTGTGFVQVLQFLPVTNILPILRTHLFVHSFVSL